MQFSAVILAILPVLAAAQGPSARGPMVESRAVNFAEDAVHIHICSTIVKCVAALAPTVVACVAAAAEEGLNPIADAACIAAAVNTGVNPPASCSGCL